MSDHRQIVSTATSLPGQATYAVPHDMSAAPISVLCVDDHPLLREGIATVLQDQDDFRLVAQACSGEEAIEQFRVHRPAVTLMDVQM
ncbi:MAG: DNA-binding response regulator, partial [Rhizobacter sp.]|nr:DNA-binding response regulator [Rhizobacter sp.]